MATIEPPPAARKCGQAGDRVPVRGDEVRVHDRVPGLVRCLGERSLVEHPGVQDERIETAEHLDRLDDRPGDRLGIADIGLDERRAGLVRDARPPLRIAPREHDPRPLRRKPPDHLGTDSRGSAGHEHTKIVEARHVARDYPRFSKGPKPLVKHPSERSNLLAFIERGTHGSG